MKHLLFLTNEHTKIGMHSFRMDLLKACEVHYNSFPETVSEATIFFLVARPLRPFFLVAQFLPSRPPLSCWATKKNLFLQLP